MGCDIHLYTDKRIDGVWKPIDSFERDTPDNNNPNGYLFSKGGLYKGRNYDLFAILANVRNGHGFAGVKTGAGFNPIAQPKGVPADATVEYREIVEQWGSDGHSHSYFTLRDLLDYDWTQTTQKEGFTAFPEWQQWAGWRRSDGQGPESYCGGVSGPSVKHIEAGQMDELVKTYRSLRSEAERQAFEKEHASTYSVAAWETDYASATGNFWSRTMPRLLAMAGGLKGVDDVRICFFFDN
jgi:hypothetical protein